MPAPGHPARLIPRLPGLSPTHTPHTSRQLRGPDGFEVHLCGPLAPLRGPRPPLWGDLAAWAPVTGKWPPESRGPLTWGSPLERGLALCGELADPPHPFPRGGQDPPRESRCRTVPTYPPEASPGLASARRSPVPPGDRKFCLFPGDFPVRDSRLRLCRENGRTGRGY